MVKLDAYSIEKTPQVPDTTTDIKLNCRADHPNQYSEGMSLMMRIQQETTPTHGFGKPQQKTPAQKLRDAYSSKKNQPEENDTQKRANKLSRTIGTFIIIIGLPVMLLGAGLFFLGENVGYRFGGFVVGIIGLAIVNYGITFCNSEKPMAKFFGDGAFAAGRSIRACAYGAMGFISSAILGYIVATAFFLIVGGTGHFNHYSRTTSYIPKAVRPSTTSLVERSVKNSWNSIFSKHSTTPGEIKTTAVIFGIFGGLGCAVKGFKGTSLKDFLNEG